MASNKGNAPFFTRVSDPKRSKANERGYESWFGGGFLEYRSDTLFEPRGVRNIEETPRGHGALESPLGERRPAVIRATSITSLGPRVFWFPRFSGPAEPFVFFSYFFPPLHFEGSWKIEEIAENSEVPDSNFTHENGQSALGYGLGADGTAQEARRKHAFLFRIPSLSYLIDRNSSRDLDSLTRALK